MASLVKTAMLRQSLRSASSKRILSANTTQIASKPTRSLVSSSQPIQRSATLERIAAFHTTARRDILPPGPQVIQGGVNEPAEVPKPSPTHGSYHWTAERLISLGLIPLTLAPFAAGTLNPTLDAVFVATVIVHSHIGFQSCIIDYFSKKQHPTLRRTMDWMLNIATVLVAIGFYEFETNDVGITEAVKRIWHAGGNDATVELADVNRLGHDGKLKHLK